MDVRQVRPAPWPLVAFVLTLAAAGAAARWNEGLSYDEPYYIGMARTIRATGRPALAPDAPAMFHDSPPLVPAALAPFVPPARLRETPSQADPFVPADLGPSASVAVDAARLGHWLLFAMPCWLAVLAALRPMGTAALAVGAAVLLANRFWMAATATVNLDVGLAAAGAWAALAVSNGWRWPAALAGAAAAGCKYQAITVAAAAVPALWRASTRRPAAASAAAAAFVMAGWLAWCWLADGWHPGQSAGRFGGGDLAAGGFAAKVRATRGLDPIGVVWRGVNDLGVAWIAVAALGVRRLPWWAWHAAFILAFNLAALALPGGFGNYLFPLYPLLAALAGAAFARVAWPAWAAAAVLALAAAKPFVEVPLPGAVRLAAACALAGMVLTWLRSHAAPPLLLAALVLGLLPFAKPVDWGLGRDSDLVAVADRFHDQAVACYENGRFAYYFGHDVPEDYRRDRFSRPPVYLIQDGELDKPAAAAFQAMLAAEYRLAERIGRVAVWRRSPNSAGRDVGPPAAPQ